jgi:uncharacterized glyoxalase superfamily protein PhnB
MSEAGGKTYLAATVCYQDAKTALQWLEAAFGFEPSLVVTNEDGQIVHAEMRFGESMIMVGAEAPGAKSPRSIGGVNTQKMHAQMSAGIDEHCVRARAAGAVILREPETQFYGDRVYVAVDPEGHVWSFGQTVHVMTDEAWGQVGGITRRTRL